MKLRPYQVEILERLRDSFTKYRRVCMVLPTGGGKTVIFTAIAEDLVQQGYRVNVLLHRKELLRQTLERVGHVANVGLVQSAKRLPPCDFLIIDECHHAVSPTYVNIIRRLDVPVLGVTATPLRRDGLGLREAFEHMVVGPSTSELVSQGYLSPLRVFAPLTLTSSFKKKRSITDYTSRELANLDQPGIYTFLNDYCGRHSRNLVFCSSVKAARAAAHDLKNAACLTGDMTDKERMGVLERFRDGTITTVTSCDLIGEGFDFPSVESISLCRPTTSLSVHLQQLGRGMRPSDTKDFTFVYDFVGNCLRFGASSDIYEWSLDGRVDYGAEKMRSCPVCFSTWPVGKPKPCGCKTTEVKPAKKSKSVLKFDDGEFAVFLSELPPDYQSLLQLPLYLAKKRFSSPQEIDVYCRYKNYKPGAAYHIKVELGFLNRYARWKKDC